MKIGQTPDSSVPVNANAPTVPAKGHQGAASTAATAASKSTQSAGVAVTVSTLARSLEATKGADATDIDMKKVSSVRTAIKEGTYKVNPEAIADKLLSNAQEMLDRSRS